ncbi:M29 family peptidase [Pandoraea thiooxydans]|uniref:Peptidase M29 n=1 Tax=Pandoraea thiooxydans TaxID=445709 RepID=A0A0G3ETE5_9BURK|nr:peptidase M29 [Pandoraea thiooxydans]AKJ70240.1 peptidase M29 [Pandoraea thiooxydans]APR93713.1 M29 family peptidase [Pandoraea thiooxydans]
MLIERIEHKWIEAFAATLRLCDIQPGDAVAIVAESQSRPVNVELAQLALERLGARPYRIVMPSPAQSAPVPVRSTGASDALQGLAPVIAALKASTLVVDCTVEGLLHAAELPAILAGGARVLMISNEHPEILERCAADPALEAKVRQGIRRLRAAGRMRVSSSAGTALDVALGGARVGGVWGWCAKPGQVAHWPGGLVLAFPAAGSVNGTLVLAPGDINLTFKRYLRERVVLSIRDDYVTDIDGHGLDADLMREYFAAWGERDAYAVSHVGWGMNPRARWESLACYDKRDCNGTEQRAFAGNFLYSTGANEVAGRHTLGHFDLPLRHCTVALDDEVIVRDGVLQGDLA